MDTAILLHGMPEKGEPCAAQSNQHWFPWLQEKLTCHGILTQTPELPTPAHPVYEDWKSVFEQFSITESTHLIGHSCGAGFLVRWLSEEKREVGKVILVAPWMDPKGEMKNGFFRFEIDPSLESRTEGISLFISSDDDPAIEETVERIKSRIPHIHKYTFHDKGHFTAEEMGTEEFPELLKIFLS